MWNWLKAAVVIEDPDHELSESAARKELRHVVDQISGSLGLLNDLDANLFGVRQVRFGPDVLGEMKTRTVKRLHPACFQSCMNEMASFWHLPNNAGGWAIDTVHARQFPPPMNLPDPETDPSQISLLGSTKYRDQQTDFGIWREDRRRHLLICGKRGVGKSKMVLSLIHQDIHNGQGCGIMVPDQFLLDQILNSIPDTRIDDVVIIDPTDVDFPPSLNPLALTDERTRMARRS